ncbi:TRAP transporter large permease [Chromohalobacter israelensis]|uniref:TRAP transporter large permease protein n=1 Tax=Chromohalobacter israelensis (strain ATCC BAA-138 / DSM 3043 / CIP 106854 / NCIMB 13768 / 1H11) TaxID=290398 RepID=Q1R0U0_CHRI1|nr:TRAP transporter large permease [Chromohalobacter salexigens]ABE57668.1 TRAP dicarboxylate transporter- DctM subunit [Chromohalobacter salexigens DSM 3043]MDO0945218.1 TRAP transporter large permease [Chromohalobacter salexigens]NWO55599.1 TRAP transporter large permease [Chromohalobacter salexigens]PWW42743.1 tripartite ATP-independent transporter DctM subunit [Chromohalobacter salexigens]
MGSEMIGGIGLALLLVLMMLRVPVALTMLIVGVVGFSQVINMGAALSMVKSVPVEVLSNYSFSAVPMFILMGVLAAHSGMAGKLFNSTRVICGGWKGGLAIAAIGSCGIFSAISGSSLATASTMTRVALPEMERYGYNRGLATGALAAGGTLGIMIPPSIALLIYAILTEQSVGDMFMAGLIPGLMGLLFYSLAITVVMRLKPSLAVAGESTTWSEKVKSLVGLVPFFGVFLLLILGIYFGAFTPTEGASVGAFATLLYAVAKGMRARGLWQSVQETLALSSVVFFMLVGAETLGYFISVSRISFTISDFLFSLDLTPIVVLLCILLLYFVLGMFMDSIAMLVITVPVVFPIIQSVGIDPVWFGIVTVLTVELGLITPPVGMNVFVIKAMAPHVGLGEIFKGVAPFIAADFVRLALLIAFPVLSLFLI